MTGAERLRTANVLHGFWCQTAHPTVVDTAAFVGPDFITIDTQHGVDLGRLDVSLFTAVASYDVASLVRVASIDSASIGRALDLGADGIVVPLVETADDAARAVAATRLAPAGSRSFGMQTKRQGPFDEVPYVVIQVETSASVDNLTGICAVDGVDALYIGPSDLGLGLGGTAVPDVNQVFDGQHPQLGKAFESVVETASGAGVRPGLHCGDGPSAVRAAEHGFTMMAVAADTGLVGKGLAADLAAARGA